ncbi:hypothetical protein THASP1DRAFT_28414 [Thamnocephalis sphaerospora]|uniref:Transmembrane protein n=1 Tax=Thamnocephalis sphaerospora TaxID=78915 RepID=A0A4P9XUA1_9FUNG|nr:hypothetical protein THASP1DRAFT_28414 [Thamnocephalis sphaerospora]|eukprot:RKP09795.1 hypothetical protein THASP1DRAFT_28414 [Thamnocephalis sphaerospora]
MDFWKPLDAKELLPNGWENDARHHLGIPLHPLGELNAIDYVMQAQGDVMEMRLRSGSLLVQVVFNVFASYVFVRSLVLSSRMVYQRPGVLAGWCCLVQAAVGVVYTLTSLLVTMPGGPPCRQALWTAGFGIVLSSLCVGITLLQKAYWAHHRNRWLLAIGITLFIPQPLVTYMVWASPAIIVSTTGCISYYPSYLPWVKLALDAPINIVFSVAFILVVYRQYLQFGSAAWARLVRNGIRTMCLIVFSNLICMFGVAFSVIGMLSEFFFILDWVITSVLLVHHCTTMRASSSESDRSQLQSSERNSILRADAITVEPARKPIFLLRRTTKSKCALRSRVAR